MRPQSVENADPLPFDRSFGEVSFKAEDDVIARRHRQGHAGRPTEALWHEKGAGDRVAFQLVPFPYVVFAKETRMSMGEPACPPGAPAQPTVLNIDLERFR